MTESVNMTTDTAFEDNPAIPTTVTKTSKRHRLTCAEKREKKNAVMTDYRNGHPRLAIQLRQELSPTQLNGILADMLSSRELSPVPPKYRVIPLPESLREMQALDSPSGFIRVIENEDSVVLKFFSVGDSDAYIA